MTGDAATSTGRRTNTTVVILPQKGTKVNISEIIDDLKSEIQQMEDAKTQITEAQEDLRNTICILQTMKEDLK